MCCANAWLENSPISTATWQFSQTPTTSSAVARPVSSVVVLGKGQAPRIPTLLHKAFCSLSTLSYERRRASHNAMSKGDACPLLPISSPQSYLPDPKRPDHIVSAQVCHSRGAGEKQAPFFRQVLAYQVDGLYKWLRYMEKPRQ